MTEREAALRIAADDLDILVDLSTHTNGAQAWNPRAQTCARPDSPTSRAPALSGLSTIDFKLTDSFADVPENQAEQIESLLPMAGCVYPFRRVAPAVTIRFIAPRSASPLMRC